MYAETELMYPYFQNFSQEVHQFEDFGSSQKPNAFSGSAVSDYNLWGEGDLFNAPSLVVEEPVMGIDLSAAISMISCGEDVMSTQSLTVSDIESGQLLSEVFYECRKDIMAKEGNETPLSEVLSINIPYVVKTDESPMTDEKLGPIQKSVSSSCLGSMEHMHEAPLRPSFLDFPVMDFEAVCEMRRAFSEGDIKTLDNANGSHVQSPMAHPRVTNASDVRMEKLTRYWSKKSKRNFGRKIKYACRKALADSQPRIHGRFAKTEETEATKRR